jgi:hypothetical protein
MSATKNEPIGYLAHRDGKPSWDDDCVCKDPVYPVDSDDDRVSVAIYTKPQLTPLTDDQIKSIWSESHNDKTNRFGYLVLARMIESAHGIGHA